MSRTTLDDVLECVICLDDVENAHLCPLCSKVACLQCWEQVIPRFCPNCRGDLTAVKLIKCYWIADLGNCVKQLKLKSEQEQNRKAELENELITIRTQLSNAPGPSAPKKKNPKPKKHVPTSVPSSNDDLFNVGFKEQGNNKGLSINLGDLKFDPEKEVVSASENVSWLNGSRTCLSSNELYSWGNVGRSDSNLSTEAYWFCDDQTLENISSAKGIFDVLDGMELVKVRFRANPFEKVKGVFSINRTAMKMANLDAVFDFMFTNPKDMDGNNLLDETKLLFFADVCGGPGGFSEYILWRKKWRAKGFGITLKGDNDFKLDSFLEAPCDSFELHYGAKDNGDICDPENIDSFCEHVMRVTDDGVYFTMADGGFSDEGQEKLQEIKLKRLFLCQCLIALRIVRPGGHFLMKIFDLLTPFSIGLVYLMHTCFDRISIHKPNTSLPANSERYLICGFKRDHDNCKTVVEYLTRINHRLIEFEGTKADIIDLVPKKLITAQETAFYTYIAHSNNTLGERQLTALLQIASFSKSPSFIDKRQNQMKKECLELYGIEEKPRTAPVQISPDAILTELLGFAAHVKVDLEKKLAYESLCDLKNVYNWTFCFLRSKDGEIVSQPTLFYSQGGSKVLRLYEENQWEQLPDNVKIELPRDTLILGMLMSELGEPSSEEKEVVLYIIDAARLAGEDIRTKSIETRRQLCKIFAKAVKRNGNLVYHKEFRSLASFDEVYKKLCNENGVSGLSQIDDGVLFLPSCKYPWIEHFSATRHRPYFFNVQSRESVFNRPNEAACDFTNTFEKMRIWWWNAGLLLICELLDIINRAKIDKMESPK